MDVFKADKPAVDGDSGGAYLLDFEGREFVVGTQSANISTLNHVPVAALATYFSYDDWRVLNSAIEGDYGQAGDSTLDEPTNLIVGSAQGDNGAKGSFRPDIILGRGGDDTLFDGDDLGDAVWANDYLFGGEGNDTFVAGAGADLVHGGDFREYGGNARSSLEDDGVDSIDYGAFFGTSAATGLTISLGLQGSGNEPAWSANTYGDAADLLADRDAAIYVIDTNTGAGSLGTDALVSIENVTATNGDDTVVIISLSGRFLAGADGRGGISRVDLAAQSGNGDGDVIDLSGLNAAAYVNLANMEAFVAYEASQADGVRIVGAETLIASQFDDLIVGDYGAINIDGGEGSDTVDYSGTSGPVVIHYGSLPAGGPALSVTKSDGGSDDLSNIEKIIGTSSFDTLAINGSITDNSLTIDAAGGQAQAGSSGFRSPIINGQGASAGLTISIVANGAGTVSNGGGGAINLLGFHTRVIASEFDDTIVDDSAGDKRFDVGFGDDVVSTAGSSGKVEIFGGWGSDHLTGGSGNDFIVADDLGSPDGVILPGGLGLNLGDGVDFLSGGDGSDYLIAFGSNDTVLGGAGDDLIEIFDGASFGDNDSPSGLIQGGSGNDVIRYVGSELGELAISFAAGDGHDLLDTSEASGEPFIDLRIPDVELNDITIIIDQNAQGFSIGRGGYQDFSGVSDIVIRIESTGDTFYLENRSLNYDHPLNNGGEYYQYTTFGDMSINGENQFLNFLYANPPGVEIGDVSAYRTDLTAFNLARAPDTGDLQGTEGTDDLAGGRGDDVLDGGDGDDTFSASGGDDVIAGGSGNDTLFLFGSRSDYDFSGDAGQFTVVDRTGRDGSIDATSVERFFFATEASFYTAEDIFGYFGTEGDDVIEGSGYDNYIYGLGGDDQLSGGDGIDIFYGGSGNDTIDGGADDDGVVFSGVSTDYVVTTLPDGTTRVEDISAGNADGIDLLINVEAILFEGDGVYMFLPAGGGPGGNSLVGTSGGDQLSGSPDADYLTGGADPTGFGGGGPPIALAETEWVLEGDQADELLGQAPVISDWDELFATPASLSAPITASDHGATLALAQFGLPPLAHDGTPLFIV
ncbi:beta strand repeat-containing protein [Alteriqipengyuania lutimaris]|uniref:beta strand repeat-containing protein n=1 Tax=Alteriqipengyuania lutimaris TaxID=1538146 RepID=UPI001CFE3AA7|nr:hypothetical protein [Alteriqipengyuania lutimaris]